VFLGVAICDPISCKIHWISCSLVGRVVPGVQYSLANLNRASHGDNEVNGCYPIMDDSSSLAPSASNIASSFGNL
jgi:hypothetical protein